MTADGQRTYTMLNAESEMLRCVHVAIGLLDARSHVCGRGRYQPANFGKRVTLRRRFALGFIMVDGNLQCHAHYHKARTNSNIATADGWCIR